MKRDIINGYEYLIFTKDEIAEARAADHLPKVDGIHPRIKIATTCADSGCRGYIECTLREWDNRRGKGILHSDAYHDTLFR